MTEQPTVQARVIDNEDTTFVDVMIVFAKHRKKILSVPIAVAIATAAISFALPNVYRASTKLLPPQQAQSSASALLSQLGGVASLAAGAAGLKNPTDVYLGMLRSRTVADRLVDKHQLKKVYGTDSQEKVRAELGADTSITSGKDGLISIEVDSKDPKLAATLANAYVAELLTLTRTLAVTEASQRRLFFQGQLEQAKNNLAKAEMALKGAIDVGGVISVDAESRTVVETVAKLRAQVSAREVELNAMRSFVTPDHPEFRRVSEELNSLRNELAKLENGRGNAASVQPTGKGGLENIQLLRDLKYHQMLYELLAKQFEAARLDEAKDPAVIQVLDPALEPERKVGPKRALLVILSALASLVGVVVWSFVLEAQRRTAHQPRVAARWAEFRSYLRRK
jgi:uncharacterized protein involved in exopolysaccharide biosynthesis